MSTMLGPDYDLFNLTSTSVSIPASRSEAIGDKDSHHNDFATSSQYITNRPSGADASSLINNNNDSS